jgi:hypothetical protein
MTAAGAASAGPRQPRVSAQAIRHEVVEGARPGPDQLFVRFASPVIERSSYVLSASLTLLLFWQWRQIPAAIWETQDPILASSAIGGGFPGLIDRALQHISDQPFRLMAGVIRRPSQRRFSWDLA